MQNKAIAKFGKITQNKGHFAVQGHSRSPTLVSIEWGDRYGQVSKNINFRIFEAVSNKLCAASFAILYASLKNLISGLMFDGLIFS